MFLFSKIREVDLGFSPLPVYPRNQIVTIIVGVASLITYPFIRKLLIIAVARQFNCVIKFELFDSSIVQKRYDETVTDITGAFYPFQVGDFLALVQFIRDYWDEFYIKS